jgi:hypothetical protein
MRHWKKYVFLDVYRRRKNGVESGRKDDVKGEVMEGRSGLGVDHINVGVSGMHCFTVQGERQRLERLQILKWNLRNRPGPGAARSGMASVDLRHGTREPSLLHTHASIEEWS